MYTLLSIVNAFTEADIDKIQVEAGLTGIRDVSFLIGANNVFSVKNVLFFIAGFAFLVYLVMGGFKIMTSSGDPKGVNEARQIITNAVIGLILTITSYWIVELVGILLELEGITNIFSS